MKIAISANGSSIDSTIHERFGRSPYFLIVETDDMRCDVVENPNIDLSSGAGIQSAGLLADKGVMAVITGICGPKAAQVFAAAGISVIQGQHGTIGDAVERFKSRPLPPASRVAVPETADTVRLPPSGGRPGFGPGAGGRGMGGCGSGGGRGRGMGRRCAAPARPPDGRFAGESASRSESLDDLHRQADALRRQMDALQSRIKDLA